MISHLLLAVGLSLVAPSRAATTAEAWLGTSRPARTTATVAYVSGTTRRDAELMLRRQGALVEVLFRGDFGQGDEAVLVSFDAGGATSASQYRKVGERVRTLHPAPEQVLQRLEGAGLYLPDLVELLAPDLRGTDWRTAGEILQSPAEGDCRNEYLFGRGAGLPTEIHYCDGPRGRRVVLIESSLELSGYQLPSRLSFAGNTLALSAYSVSAEAGPPLAEVVTGGQP